MRASACASEASGQIQSQTTGRSWPTSSSETLSLLWALASGEQGTSHIRHQQCTSLVDDQQFSFRPSHPVRSMRFLPGTTIFETTVLCMIFYLRLRGPRACSQARGSCRGCCGICGSVRLASCNHKACVAGFVAETCFRARVEPTKQALNTGVVDAKLSAAASAGTSHNQKSISRHYYYSLREQLKRSDLQDGRCLTIHARYRVNACTGQGTQQDSYRSPAALPSARCGQRDVNYPAL